LSNFAEPLPHAACHSPEGDESIRTGIASGLLGDRALAQLIAAAESLRF
jgi:hypothetical protein